MVHAARRTIARYIAAAAFLALLAFLAFPARAPCAEFPRDTPHSHFRLAESCPRCHLPGRDGRPDPARFRPDADALCLGCHRQVNPRRTHPMDVPPATRSGRFQVPADLRLADDGRMLCLTCHSSHGAFLSGVRTFPGQDPEDRAGAGGPRFRTFFLRRSAPEQGAAPLCEACHRMPR